MHPETLKISMAGFFHDIGKFAGKKEMEISSNNIDSYDEQLYLKSSKGRFSHYHALYTARFIEKFSDFLPYELNAEKWGDGDIFINLAAMHHKPETPMQQIITQADCLSSGWDRDEFEKKYNSPVHYKDYKKTRLLPILEQLNLSEDKDKKNDSIKDYKYRYPLKHVSPENIFPDILKNVVPETNKDADLEYKNLFHQFIENLKLLSHKENIELWYEHFDSLMMIFTSHIPAARAGSIIPDVSLYDHCRTTAALAAALYLYHLDTDTLNEKDIKSDKEKKFLLINGDFKGIQKFIFTSASESEKFRSKILRGRSFAVSLFSELASDMLCRETGLPFSSVVLNAAGKFTIIAPNITQTKMAVKKVKQQINDWLVQISFGETMLNISYIEASSNDFTKGRFVDLWDRFNIVMNQEKYSGFDIGKYSGAVTDYLDRFINEPGKPAICPLCGKRPALDKFQNEPVCQICRDHIFLGSNIVKKKKISIYLSQIVSKSGNWLHEPVFGQYQLSFAQDSDSIKNTDLVRRNTDLVKKNISLVEKNTDLVKCWDLENDNIGKSDVSVKFIKGYIPVYSEVDFSDDRIISSKKTDKTKLENIDQMVIGEPKTLHHIACTAKRTDPERQNKYQGIESLGVLKADVDNLGLLMTCGLKEKRFTISRLATLSRQLNYYFAVYLPWFLENKGFNNIYTVFAGGDDLFLIGPWNSIIDLAANIRKSFSDYVCNNGSITFSAGISLHKPHTTIDIMAESSENLLEKAKSRSEAKNRLNLFSTIATWQEVQELLKIESVLQNWLDKKWISRVMFYNLNEFINMAEKEKSLLQKKEIHLKEMACTKWRSLLSYSADRNIADKSEDGLNIKQEIMKNLINWLKIYGGKLRIPVWKILYNRRQEG